MDEKIMCSVCDHPANRHLHEACLALYPGDECYCPGLELSRPPSQTHEPYAASCANGVGPSRRLLNTRRNQPATRPGARRTLK
jgi:hypothetical protein